MPILVESVKCWVTEKGASKFIVARGNVLDPYCQDGKAMMSELLMPSAIFNSDFKFPVVTQGR